MSTKEKSPAKASVWDVIASPTSPPDLTKRSNSTTHGGFDNDDDTRIAIIERIARRQVGGGVAAAKRPTPPTKPKIAKAKKSARSE